LRSLTVAAQLSTVLAAWKILELNLEWLPMLSGIATLAAINLLTFLRLRSSRPVTNLELFAQLSVDVFVLSLLLYYAGGSANPFVSLYLLPLVIAAATLPARYTWGMAALTTSCYSWLMVLSHPAAARGHANGYGQRLQYPRDGHVDRLCHQRDGGRLFRGQDGLSRCAAGMSCWYRYAKKFCATNVS